MANAPKNTSKDKIHLNAFNGGVSIDYKYGIANSFYQSQALDFRQKASQMSVLPGAYNLSNNLSDQIQNIVQDPSGVRWGIGNLGNIYKINTSNVISNTAQLSSNGATGLVYHQLADQLYICGQQTVSTYGQLGGSSVFRSDLFAQSASTFNGVVSLFNTATNSYDGSQLRSAGTATYNVPTSISEAVGQTCTFVPDIEPLYSFKVFITTVGTGNWTLTMHDALNNVLGTSTIANANLVVGFNEFKFSSQVRVITTGALTGTLGSYHFHLTSTVADGVVQTYNSGDLTGCNMQMYAYRLVKTNNGWHPSVIFALMLCIGNGNYLSTYDFSNDAGPNNQQWVRHRLRLDFGYEVCGLSVNNQYLVIAAEKRSTNSSRSYQDGYLYFWDGSNASFNFKIEIPMGAPYGLFTQNNITYFICAGSLFAWGGGQQVIKVRYIGYQNTDYLGTVDHTIVNPYMMDARYNLLMIGYPSTTTNVNLTYGVYSWGAVELTYPNSFGYSYALSNGLQNYSAANNLQIGCIRNFVDTLYISYQYTDTNSVIHYALDVVDNSSTAAPNFSWQSLIWDGGVRYKTKKALRLKINFLPLPTGCSITANYTKNRGTTISADPVTGIPYTASTGDTDILVDLSNVRFHELQWGFTGTASGTTPPTITGITLETDPLEDEVDVKKDG